ncbi:hypothetical protein TUM4438_35690 [Shewanella sairae]|uniref:FlgO domain-containing protein n=1 Tax=Shewanella sairae TaxID=190310 RepID=A0ABQ4PPJ1_9GAMM|nr:FlgO family outer membrane protein [Shewanella sairae]MCL1129259.1 hypothetical protein [Shewanella sairae]GIU50274.1 hypothetical protein TUM4438_35690 [Shewanella sairae]
MHKSIIILPLLFACGCNTSADVEKLTESGYGLPQTGAINHIAQQMVNDLVRQNDSLRSNQPLIVTTPVVVDDMQTTNAIGLQLQQGLIAALHDHQFNLVDINVADALKVTPSGDFILTRDWQELPTDVAVEHVVVSTMSLTNAGIALNSRVVNVTNNRVVSATQGFVNVSDMPEYMGLSQKVIAKHGMLYRNAQQGEHIVEIVGDK